MKTIADELTHAVLASRHHHHGGVHGNTDGVIDWWEWLILIAGAVLVLWALVKKFGA